MAFQNNNTLISNREMLIELVVAPFRAIGRGVVFFAENSAKARALRMIAMLTDTQLAARGVTRDQAIEAVFTRDI